MGPRVAAPSAAAEEAALRHNVLALGADYALFLVGLALASQHTILPAFARHLGASSVLIGAIPAVMTAGWYLPSLFAAGHTEALPRKLPFVLRWSVWERVPALLLALVAFFVAPRLPGLALVLLLALLMVATATGGVLMPAWMDVVARAVPVAIRGRFFGMASLAAGLAALAASLGAAWVLERAAPPASYGFCFLAAFVFYAASYWALCLVREPEAAPAAPVRLGDYLARIPGVLRADPNLVRYLVARVFVTLGAMASGFFAVYALRAWEAPDRWAAVFTAAFLAGQVAANLLFGWLADRAGHRLVVMAGTGAMLAANLAALLAPSLPAFGLVLALSGMYQAAHAVSGHNVLLEFAPTPRERPTYVGLGTTAIGPVAIGAPLLAGALVDTIGYAAVFALGAAGSLAGLAVLGALVRDPRRRPADRA
jgi:MFS family permease